MTRSLLLGGAALDPVEWAHVVAQDVVPNDAHPGVALGQVVVKLGRSLLERGQLGPGHVGEVVVLVVVADVPREDVEPAVVRVSLLRKRRGKRSQW